MEKYIFGIDIGGTSVKIGLFNNREENIEKWEFPTRKAEKGKYIISDVADSVLECLKKNNISKQDVLGIAMGVPCTVDESGNVFLSANLGWSDYNPKKELENILNLPVEIDKDVNFAALGEMKYGSAKGYKNVVVITLGTGLGCATITNGEVIKGALGKAGELGHICLNYSETQKCSCGLYGCLEQYASATGIVNIAKKYYNANNISESATQNLTAKDILEGAEKGLPLDCEAMKEFADYLGKGMAIIRAIVAPEIFIIGGGVSNAGKILIDYIKPAFEKYTFEPKNIKFDIAALKNDAGIYGAMSKFINNV